MPNWLSVLFTLLPKLIDAFKLIEAKSSTQAAATELADHLTPGKPNSPHLS